MERFYLDIMGFLLTEEVVWNGHRCVFLRCNTEHHSLALYPIAMRQSLGMSEKTTLMHFGVQLANYRQLKSALHYLEEQGCQFLDVPKALTPGIDYSAHVIDPSGHAIQLYCTMDQVGWDGQPRPKNNVDAVDLHWKKWPETLSSKTDTYMGEVYLGPWG
jgi:hypothetical protein